jgi:hypothetical protein
MRNFVKIAAGVETLPLMLDLYRQPELLSRLSTVDRGP